MTSCGRGRGWASTKNKETVLRRPGGLSPKFGEWQNVIDGINKLVINEPASIEKINDIADLVSDTKNGQNLTSLFDGLNERALDDKTFGIKLAILFSNTTFCMIEDNEEKKLRSLLLSILQDNFTKKDEIRNESVVRFRNSVSLLGEVYYRMRLTSGQPIRVLELPLFSYWNMLLETAAPEDIELIVTQVAINGRLIYKRQKEELDKLLMIVRKLLITKYLDTVSKTMLLLMIDLSNQRYNPLSGDLQDFYVSILGTTILVDIQRHDENLTINTKSKAEDDNKSIPKNNKQQVNSKEDLNFISEKRGILMTVPKQEKIATDEEFKQKDYTINMNNRTNFTTGSVPRAIRGSGAGDLEKDNSNRLKSYSTNIPSVKHISNNKAWGHDDRFEKDYE